MSGIEWACPDCAELQTELSAARSRNRDVLARIANMKLRVRLLEDAQQKARSVIKTFEAKHGDCDAVVKQCDVLRTDVLMLVGENEALELKLAGATGRVTLLRELVSSLQAERDALHNSNVLLRTTALGQGALREELNRFRRQNESLRILNKQLMVERMTGRAAEAEMK